MTNQADKDLEDLKYTRTGYLNQQRLSDVLLASLVTQLPGDGNLPLRWAYTSLEDFKERYGHLGSILWAAANSSHLLVVNGFKILRVWTDADNACWVDVDDVLASQVSKWLKVEDIPAGNTRKCRPFTKRIKVWQQYQMGHIATAVKVQYGLDIT